LTVAEAKRGVGSGSSAGTQTLTLLSTPIVVQVLGVLAGGSRSLVELRREAGLPPQATMRSHLRTLTETGVVTRQRQNDFPGSLEYEITTVGRELWAVAQVLGGWLAIAPRGPIELGTPTAKGAIKAMVEGWGTSIARALAARPHSLAELTTVLSDTSYPSLERRLGAMRDAEQVEKAPATGPVHPYRVSDWLRRAVAPLAAAARWERLNVVSATKPISRHDVESAFLLALPLVRLSPELSGSCRLTVELQGEEGTELAGVQVSIEEGRIASCATRLRGEVDASASGPPHAWLLAVIEQDTRELEIAGNRGLAGALLEGLHGSLFAQEQTEGTGTQF
jgi:DNA-binding HxlR family transcriptional regulator